ncbi:MAG: phytoene/squalene synthase family protein [Gammaproteobacteria bacterium]
MPTLDTSDAFAKHMLPQVSRTFALTIPQLPAPLRDTVTNAYLLCRIADTVEDEPTLAVARKHELQALLLDAIEDPVKAERFSQELAPLLSSHMLDAEHELIGGAAKVIATTQALPSRQRSALTRCLRIMCQGMSRFQEQKSASGLATLAELKEYCYVVAGVVGEMLTELFCDRSEAIDSNRQQLMDQSVAFGRGLQMTNILKDVWEDRAADTCWLPREVFAQQGFDLADLAPGKQNGSYREGLHALIGVAHASLREALAYTQTIPRDEVGIRRFCLWSIGLAVLTLRKIAHDPDYTSGQQVKVSRRAVRATILMSNFAGRSNRVIGGVFNWLARDLPLAPSSTTTALHGAARG